MHKKIMRVLLCGSFHGKNKGDEAIAEAEIAFIREHFPEAEITVATKDPRYFSTQYSVNAVSIVNPVQMLRAIHRSTHVIIGGGGLFFEPYAFHAFNLLRNQSYVWPLLCAYARLAHKKVAFVGIGVETMRLRFSEWVLRIGMNRAHAILVRDDASAKYLKEIGVSAPVRVTADSAFLLHAYSSRNIQKENMRIGVSLHYGISILQTTEAVDRWVSECAQAFIAFSKTCTQPIEWVNVPMHQKDGLLTERVFSILRDARQETSTVSLADKKSSELLSVLSELDMHIGMRMHGAILSTVAQTPCVVFSYARKVDQYIEILSRYNSTIAPHMVVPYTETTHIAGALEYVSQHLEEARAMQRQCVAQESQKVEKEFLAVLS